MFDPVGYDTYYEYVEKIDKSVIDNNHIVKFNNHSKYREYRFIKQETVELFSLDYMERDTQLLVLQLLLSI